MIKIAHVTDPHFNFLTVGSDSNSRDESKILNFCQEIKAAGCEAAVISGDLTEAPYLYSDLKLFQKHLGLPVYFILGNHDFYRGSFAKVNQLSRMITDAEPNIKWLQCIDSIKLTEKACLIGVDGWYDIKAGGAEHSRLAMTDFFLIEEFRHQPHMKVVSASRKLAHDSSMKLEEKIKKVVGQFETIYIATHVPPFLEAALSPQRELSDFNWAPYMTNIVMGDTLVQLSEEYRDKKFVVLTGHTHTDCYYNAWRNLEVRVGKADYGYLMFNTLEIE
jgi:predicted phosphohydrolase